MRWSDTCPSVKPRQGRMHFAFFKFSDCGFRNFAARIFEMFQGFGQITLHCETIGFFKVHLW